MLLVGINVRRTEADVTHRLTVASLTVRDRRPARISKTRYERRVKPQRARACAKDSDEQTLLLPARQHRDLISIAPSVHLKTEKLAAVLQHPVKQWARSLKRCDFHD